MATTIKNEYDEDILPGYKGNLDKEQQRLLRVLWSRLYQLFEKNKEISEVDRRGGPDQVASTSSSNEKQPGKDIPKDEKAKEEAKNAQETKEMDDFLDQYGGPILRRTTWEFTKMDHPDTSMLRFLRARKWDVDRALAMLAAACKFRIENDVAGIIFKGEEGLQDVPGFLNQFRRGISYIKGNTDHGEYPVYFIHVARHFTSAQKHQVLQQFVLLAMENARTLTTPPYEKVVVVFDMAGFGLKNMDWQCVLFLVKCLEAYYPESLQRIYVHGAPWIFKGIWQVLQPMLDPVVREKIKFSSKASELAEYVSLEKLRNGMGGNMDWDWDYVEPETGENNVQNDVESRKIIQEELQQLTDEFERVTLEWIKEGNSDDQTPELTHRREVLANQIRIKIYQLNPFVRAKSVYQRTGILKDDGSFTWEYPQASGKSLFQTVNTRHCYGALINWLRDHDEDTLEDSYGHKKLHEVSKDGSIKASYGPPSGKQKNKKDVEASSSAAVGVVAAVTATAVTASASALNGDAAAAPTSSANDKGQEPRTKSDSQMDHAVQAADRSEPKLPVGSEKSSLRFPEQQPYQVDGENEQNYSVAAVGTGVAVAASGFSYADHNKNGQDLEPTNGNGSAHDYRPESRASQDDDFESANGDIPEDYEQENGSEGGYKMAADDDQTSTYSGESITPETAILPDYMLGKPPTAAECRIDDNDCRQDLALVREAMALFLNSSMREAEEICLQGARTRLYKAEGMALINTVKSIMTFEPQDFQTAIMSCKHSMTIASHLRKKKGTINKLVSGGKMDHFRCMNLVQLHAELVSCESQLLKAILGIFYSGDSVAFLRQALSLRSAYNLMQDLNKFIEKADAEAEEAEVSGKKAPTVQIDQDFRSGVYLSTGLCGLVLSLLPAKALRLVEGFGYHGDRKVSLDLFARAGGWSKNNPHPTISADEEGVRRPLGDIVILAWHLVASSYVAIGDIDFEFADKILSWNLVRFPNGIFFLYFSARLYAAQALPEKAIEYYRNAIESQREYKQLHHLCFWDLSLTYLCTCDFARAYECYDVLSRESNWSKAIYQYAKAVMLYETGLDDRTKSATIMRTVGKLGKKVAGRQIPLEKWVSYKAKKFIAQQNRLALPGLELSYLLHCVGQSPVFLLVENTLTRIDEFIDELESYENPRNYGTGENEYWSAYCTAFFLRGVALCFVAYPEPQTLVRLPAEDLIGPLEEIQADAILSFKKVFEHGHRLDEVDRYLVYFAHYELGRLRTCMGQETVAKEEFQKVLSAKPLEAKGKTIALGGSKASYLLSNMCQMRAHAALETMRIQRSRSSVFPTDGSLASQTIGGSISTSKRSGSLMSNSRSMTSRATLTQPRTSAKTAFDHVVADDNLKPRSHRSQSSGQRLTATDYSRRG